MYTAKKVAAMLGQQPDYIRRYSRQLGITPYKFPNNKRKLIWTTAQVAELKEYLDNKYRTITGTGKPKFKYRPLK